MDMPADMLRQFVQYLLKRQVGPANHVLLVAAYCHVQKKYMLYTNDISAPPLLLSREQLLECPPAVVKALTRLYQKSYTLEEMCRSALEQNYQLHARIHGKQSDTCFLCEQKPAPAANCTLGMSSLPLPRLMVPPALLLISQYRRFQRHLILFL
ncbi:hypothetical protein MIR68_010023 [Amoeboaphelidium protococcarum]|nr:hypothetical protein MIR68_010023 [Amoeboaphelidium protococcarum]